MVLRRILACAGIVPLLLAATEPLRLQPSGPWVVDYAESSCRLTRTFGEGDRLTKLGFESSGPGAVDMLVVGNPLRTSGQTVSAKFLPVGTDPFDGVVEKTVRGSPAVLWSTVPLLPAGALAQIYQERTERLRHPNARPAAVSVAEQEERRAQRQQFAAAVTELEIKTSRRDSVILETGPLGPAIAAFDKCSRDSLKDWGVDPDLEDKIVRPLWAIKPATWLSSEDYPPAMMRSGEESDVTLRLLVDSSGRVTKCTSLTHFAEKEFNRVSCQRVTQRARFEPAELADGTKVPSYYTFRIKFRLQG